MTNELTLRSPQWQVFSSQKRFRVVSGGRRLGKSYLSKIELARAAWHKPDQNIWYVSPTYRQSKEIMWGSLKDFLLPYATEKNETELTLRLLNGSRISLKGADNPDALRGSGLDFLVMDEAASIAHNVWPEVLRPACADKEAPALFISTPRSFNWFYDLFLRGQGEHSTWKSWQFTTAEGGNVSLEEIEAAKQEMSKAHFEQEMLASFTALSGRVYHCFDRNLSIKQDVIDQKGPVLIGLDFNVSPMSACIGQRMDDELHMFDEIELMNSNTYEMTEEIKRRYVSRPVVIYPDPSGRARKSSAVGGQTDFTILQQAGFQVRAYNSAPAVADRVNEVNALCLNAEGRTRLFIHPRCRKLIKCLEGLTYKEGTSIVDKESGLDHMVDGLGYLIDIEFPIRTKFTTATIEGV